MALHVKRTTDNVIFRVRKYVRSDNENQELIWCDDWYGKHRIGYDCEWHAFVTKKHIYYEKVPQIHHTNGIIRGKQLGEKETEVLNKTYRKGLSKKPTKL